MAPIARWRITSDGYLGGPGVTTFFADGTNGGTADIGSALKTFLEVCKAYQPIVMTYHYPGTVDVLEDSTGILLGTIAVSQQTDTVCTSPGNYPAPAGFECRWDTGLVYDSHRLRGRTFFVPATDAVFQSDGTLSTSPRSTLQTAATAMVAAVGTKMRVWHRPLKDKDGVITRTGASAAVASALIPDKVVVLTSRRD
jgi:hypothetical protein